jgi:hypothetical protein
MGVSAELGAKTMNEPENEVLIGGSYLRGFSLPSLVLQIFKNAVDGPGRVPQSPRAGRF